jgi:thioredoxin-related protein
MKNLDIEIYMTNFKGFFDKNPEQLKQLIGDIDPEKFYNGIREIVEENSKDSEQPLEPTRKQIIGLLVDLNINIKNVKKVLPYMEHHMGLICLN